ncbi:hypothetical protein [Candidatus Finniella inopinata]|uniref:UDP-N-acetylglucosamine kinase n=1 Tax=Candidatus Finniella inopinata TaxID=1696036 RepID=A0A4Q7DGN7_9PROT|nr:hypothetical protein [Candidatus Finniella inopinata]RZI46051.1 hypothetical protein EQU50_03720 [Candidatus Finniella inopinata]
MNIFSKPQKKLNILLFSLVLALNSRAIASSASSSSSDSSEVIPNEQVIKPLLTEYSPSDVTLINQDLDNIRKFFFAGKKTLEKPVYVATAGGPGSSKTTILESYMQNHPDLDLTYIDPDQAALKYMFTYMMAKSNFQIARSQAEGKDYAAVSSLAYNKWRAASNYIANTLLNEAVKNRFNVSHGTTSTGGAIENLYKNLKRNCYRIVLLLCGSGDENRENALNHREKVQAFYQATHTDSVEKGKLFYSRFPIYFQNADEIEIYWTGDFLRGSKKVATFDRTKGLNVIDTAGFNMFKDEYERNKAKDLPTLDVLTTLKT